MLLLLCNNSLWWYLSSAQRSLVLRVVPLLAQRDWWEEERSRVAESKNRYSIEGIRVCVLLHTYGEGEENTLNIRRYKRDRRESLRSCSMGYRWSRAMLEERDQTVVLMRPPLFPLSTLFNIARVKEEEEIREEKKPGVVLAFLKVPFHKSFPCAGSLSLFFLSLPDIVL